ANPLRDTPPATTAHAARRVLVGDDPSLAVDELVPMTNGTHDLSGRRVALCDELELPIQRASRDSLTVAARLPLRTPMVEQLPTMESGPADEEGSRDHGRHVDTLRQPIRWRRRLSAERDELSTPVDRSAPVLDALLVSRVPEAIEPALVVEIERV